jgi:hypothetical protein
MLSALCVPMLRCLVLFVTLASRTRDGHKAHKPAAGLAPLTACAKAVDACAKASASAHGGASFSEGEPGRESQWIRRLLQTDVISKLQQALMNSHPSHPAHYSDDYPTG